MTLDPSLGTPWARALQPYQPGKPISELEREYGVTDIVKLASNENPLGPGTLALRAMQSALREQARYPDGNGFALKHALAERHGVSMEQITLGNGSNDVLDLVARAFLGPGLNGVISEHAFAAYPIAIQAAGGTIVSAPARAYGHDLDAMRECIDADTRVVFIANPNNPTGTWLDAASLRRFLESVPERVLVVVDEAYIEYVGEADYPDASRWLSDFANLIVTRTFSKAYGLAGLRIGYGLSQAPVADLMNRVRQPFNTNAVAQAAALAALADRQHIDDSVRLNQDGMRQWTQACSQLGLAYIPSVGNFLTIDMARPAGAVFEALLRKGVIVRPVGAYGLPEHLRVSIGTRDENHRAIVALGAVLS